MIESNGSTAARFISITAQRHPVAHVVRPELTVWATAARLLQPAGPGYVITSEIHVTRLMVTHQADVLPV